jgi:5,10-methylene-tetrahydrofolate dehydrogenase/methenyl tetrahydrofolate cyclohydrolase
MADAFMINGKAFAEKLRDEIADRVNKLKELHNLTPG